MMDLHRTDHVPSRGDEPPAWAQQHPPTPPAAACVGEQEPPTCMKGFASFCSECLLGLTEGVILLKLSLSWEQADFI